MQPLPELPVYMFQPNFGGFLSMVLTIVLPLTVAVITTRITSSRVKGILLLIVVSVKTLVEALISNGNDYINLEWVPFLMNLVLNFAIAVTMHFGIWKPTISGYVQEHVGLKSRNDEWNEATTR